MRPRSAGRGGNVSRRSMPVSGERFAKPRAYLLTERPLLVLCVFQMTAARLENIVRRAEQRDGVWLPFPSLPPSLSSFFFLCGNCAAVT